MILSYQDFGNNPEFALVRNLIYFSGDGTLLPIFVQPRSDVYLGSNFVIDFTLPEPALENTCFMVFTRTGGLPDPASPHTIVFSSILEQPRQHIQTLTALSVAVNLSFVESVTPKGYDLVDGSIYEVTLSYQDGGGNPPATQIHESIAFAGSVTKPAILTAPITGSTIAEEFAVSFSLPEDAFEQSVTILIIPEDETADSVSLPERSQRSLIPTNSSPCSKFFLLINFISTATHL